MTPGARIIKLFMAVTFVVSK